MRLHQLGHDFVLLGQLLFEVRDPPLIGVLGPPVARRPLERGRGMVQHMFDPRMDQGGLNVQLLGQVRHGDLLAQMTPNNFCLLLRGEMSASTTLGIFLRFGLC
jgi:hypothetical protein